MCIHCGDHTKPACDQDPDCAFHCYADEHLEIVSAQLADWQWFHYGARWVAGVDVLNLAGRVPAGRPVSP